MIDNDRSILQTQFVTPAGQILKYKEDSKLQCFIGWLLKPFNPLYMTNYFTSFFGTFYVPSSYTINAQFMIDHRSTIDHEDQHYLDLKQYHIFMILTYIFFPLPILFSGRWLWEFRAYLKTLEYWPTPEQKKVEIESIITNLASSKYFWAWPKSLMRRTFYRRLNLS